MDSSFKTPKGTELPLMDIRGKPYLQVAHRLIWFREEKPLWTIKTKIIEHDAEHTISGCEIIDESGRVISTGHKMENTQGFADHLEKSETSAVGRALSMLGYGTQFALEELDEGKRLADSPIVPGKSVAFQDVAHKSVAPAIPRPKDAAPPPAKPASQVKNHAPNAVNSAQVATKSRNTINPTGTTPGEFVIEFGKKYKGKRIHEIKPKDLAVHLNWFRQQALDTGVPLKPELEKQIMDAEAAAENFYMQKKEAEQKSEGLPF